MPEKRDYRGEEIARIDFDECQQVTREDMERIRDILQRALRAMCLPVVCISTAPHRDWIREKYLGKGDPKP